MSNYKHCRCNTTPCCCPRDPKHCNCNSEPCCCPRGPKHCNCNSKPCCCPKGPKPPQKLTTGLFRVPELSTSNSTVDLLIIGLNNHTATQKVVMVKVDRCPEAVFPATTQETISFSKRIILKPYDCTQIHISSGPLFVPRDLLRVTFQGDIVKETISLEATVVGQDNTGVHEPTMFFRHDDLIRIFP